MTPLPIAVLLIPGLAVHAAPLCGADARLCGVRTGDGRRSSPRRQHGRDRARILADGAAALRARRPVDGRLHRATRSCGVAPERVTRLALLDTGSRADPPERASGARRRSSSHGPAARRDQRDAVAAPRAQGPAGRRGAEEDRRATWRKMTGADAFIRQQTAIMTRPDSRPDLPKIKCPTLVLVGDGDQLTPPACRKRSRRSFRIAGSSSFPTAGISPRSSAPTPSTRRWWNG